MPARSTDFAQFREAPNLVAALGATEPPIAVEDAARLLGAEIRYEPLAGELSGMLFVDGDRPVIGVNALQGKARQRFTVAHEVGHLVLHDSQQLHIDRGFRLYLRSEVSGQATDRDEIEANRYAAELLMPAEFLIKDVAQLDADFGDELSFRRLATRYQVSQQAMIYRLTNLGLIVPGT